MAKGPPVGRRATPTGRARMGVYLAAGLRDELARVAFERGVPVSALLEEGARRLLAGGEAFEALRARWVHMGEASGWAAQGAACPADAHGAVLAVRPAEGGWRWQVQAAGAVVEGVAPLRSRTAAMLEAEAAAAALTPEEARRLVEQRAHRARRGR